MGAGVVDGPELAVGARAVVVGVGAGVDDAVGVVGRVDVVGVVLLEPAADLPRSGRVVADVEQHEVAAALGVLAEHDAEHGALGERDEVVTGEAVHEVPVRQWHFKSALHVRERESVHALAAPLIRSRVRVNPHLPDRRLLPRSHHRHAQFLARVSRQPGRP